MGSGMDNTVAKILAGVLNMPPDAIVDELAMSDVEAWDSLKHMEMIVAFEQAYQVEFTFDEIVAMRNVAAIRQVLQAKGFGH
jgi:acyl carrier protein